MPSWNLLMKNHQTKSGNFFNQHLQDLRCSFCEYFPLRDESKNWIKDPFNVDIDKLTGLTAAEQNGLIEMSLV
jgi:hypothetical protein